MDTEIKNTAPNSGKFWFALDNAAKIYPAIINENVTAVFRLTARLKQPVKIKPFRKAVLQAEKRFPFFRVQLKEGFFWYYLEYLSKHISVEPDDKPPCRKFPKGSLLIRIPVEGNNISIECSHILTDGSGALEFFKTILIAYSGECGTEIPSEYHFNEPTAILAEEYEDAYNRFFKAEIPPMVKRSKAFHLPFSLRPSSRFSRLNAMMPLEQMKEISHAKGVSITVYLTSVYLFILQEIYESLNAFSNHKKRKKLRVQVPVNLRNIFPSKTMRNFSLFVMPEIDLRLGHYEFDEIIKSVYHQTKLETDEKLIHKNISRNVGSERKLFIRGIPLFLKGLILRMKYYSLGTSQYSGVLTNLGKIDLPDETGKLINYFIMTPPPPNKMLKISCGVAGFGDNLVLSFGNITQSLEFEKKFMQFLRDQNISVEWETNR
ncbi:hypothetical protein D1164_19990 [Mariniphaga sediminis]|uniref:Alcohol acetyltransferase n=1 Tax=Mariniphaga sediminis TaxID=1628158 RepID=A0A399CYD5_9BACT|nr:hypothetical protein [Mariniphaga sediminis]RIH63411.1 hypothetical protein D1164_19990 [Mariniphaga sediminis]